MKYFKTLPLLAIFILLFACIKEEFNVKSDTETETTTSAGTETGIGLETFKEEYIIVPLFVKVIATDGKPIENVLVSSHLQQL